VKPTSSIKLQIYVVAIQFSTEQYAWNKDAARSTLSLNFFMSHFPSS